MIKIPSDIRSASFHASLRQGTLFRMRGDEPFPSSKYHVFIVLNYDPNTDEALILVNGTSQVDKRLNFYNKYHPNLDPENTTVVLEAGKYPFFPEKTLVDCNSVKTCRINPEHFENGNLIMMDNSLSDDDMEYIINGVICRRRVSQFIKSKVKPQD